MTDKSSSEIHYIDTNGLIVEIGYTPNSEAFKGLIAMNQRDEIEIDEKGQTNIDGILLVAM